MEALEVKQAMDGELLQAIQEDNRELLNKYTQIEIEKAKKQLEGAEGG